MTFFLLPAELLDGIIKEALPEGFESLALTCKRINARCKPLLKHYNEIKSQFGVLDFRSLGAAVFSSSSSTIRTSYDVITRIAVEPSVARYVVHANLNLDSPLYKANFYNALADTKSCATVKELFAKSSYLRDAGLNWEDYYAKVEADLRANRYSQHAAAFLLTLLPNLEVLTLPYKWMPCPSTDALIHALIRRAQQPPRSYERLSFTRLASLKLDTPRPSELKYTIGWEKPFLMLPSMRSFRSCSYKTTNHDRQSLTYGHLSGVSGATLRELTLLHSCISELDMADFLKNCGCLETLIYSHCTQGNATSQYWDICKFVDAIEREVGNHLMNLSLSLSQAGAIILPGRLSFRDFHNLQALEISLKLASCSSNAASIDNTDREEVREHRRSERTELTVGDLVPTSLSILSIVTGGTNLESTMLKGMFRDFDGKANCQLTALEHVYLYNTSSGKNEYYSQCDWLQEKFMSTHITLHSEFWQRPMAWAKI